MGWIKNLRHPDDDPKIQLIADLTGKHPERVYCAVMRWFFWVDAHVAADTSVSSRVFRHITKWKDDSLLAAMMHPSIDWLEEHDFRYRPTRPDSHFSKSAKQRAITAERVSAHRIRNGASVTDVTPGALTRKEKRREDNHHHHHRNGAHLGEPADPPDGGGGGGDAVTLTPEQAALYERITARPAWLPDGAAWIDAVTARDLAALQTTTAALIDYTLRETRCKRRDLDNPAGFAVMRLRRPDAGVLRALDDRGAA